MQNDSRSDTPGGDQSGGDPSGGDQSDDVPGPDGGVDQCPGAGGAHRHPTGLRERKKRATARALHETTVELVASHGMDGVTVDEICELVGVSTRTFFNYFPSKEDAVTASMPVPPGDDLLAVFEAGGPTGNLVADLGEMVAIHMVGHATTVDNLAAHHRLLHREPQLVGRWRSALHAIEQRFARAIATREDREPDDTGVVVLAAMTSAGIRTAMQRWGAGGGQVGLDVHVHEVFSLLAASLDTDALLSAPPAPRAVDDPATFHSPNGTDHA